MASDLLTFVLVGLFTIITTLLLVLPQFDVVQYIAIEGEIFQQGLSWLNWFVPVSELFIITGVWITCLAIYQAYLIFTGSLSKFIK